VAYYDDLDPRSLTGGITFSANGYTALATRCRTDRVRVVGDIHAHPGPNVRQSAMDAAHPMSALPGHIALVVPDFAQGKIRTDRLGAHLYLGSGTWTSRYGADVMSLVRVTGTGLLAHATRSLTHTVRRAWRTITSRAAR
jgi:hypothetical protein